jgi:uncharacterized RDD family membrane protein YckC
MFCSVCGHSNADGSMSCSKCGSPLAMVAAPAGSGQVGSAAAPATAAATQGANPPALAAGAALAGIGDRAIATLLDIVVAASPFAVIGMWAAVRWGGVTPNGFEVKGTAAGVALGAVAILAFLYFWLMEGALGATLGKFILNLRVRRLDGSGMGLSKSLVRNLSRVVDAIGVYLVGFLIANFSVRKQRLGDHLAGTVVVQGDSGKVTRAIAAVAWAAIIIACFVGAYRLHHGAGGAGVASALLTSASTSVPPQNGTTQATAAGQGRVTRAEMGTDSTDTFQIIGPATEFYTDTPQIVCVWQIAGTDISTPLKSVWIAEDVGDAAPPNYQLGAKSMSGVNEGKFYVTSPANGWPIGKYRLEIYIGDTLAKQIPFSIKQR